jgi:hypothetical protein
MMARRYVLDVFLLEQCLLQIILDNVTTRKPSHDVVMHKERGKVGNNKGSARLP